MSASNRRSWITTSIVVALLILPVLGVHAWMAWTFPSYLSNRFGQDIVFAVAWCGLLVLIARLRLLGFVSVPLALFAYLAWLFLVLGEAVSYYLQADTFNARFIAHLNLSNLGTGLRAFPTMIGGGVVLFAVMIAICAALLEWMRRAGLRDGAIIRGGPRIVVLVIMVLTVLGVDSAPRRLIEYLTRVQQSTHFADTPQGRAVARLLDLHPVAKKNVIAAPGKNLVWIYMESLERTYWDPKVFPGLTPNLDNLRKQGLDFSGFETFAGANYTMAGLFSSQCGVPLFSSPFAELDAVAGNNTDVSTFHPKVTCFGDVLHKAGYTQVYMGGAPIEFSNKGLFFKLHGYDQIFGLNELEAQANGKLPESGWGLYDNVLFNLALSRYRELEAAGKPFNLSMLTLDTHPPHGRPSPNCPKYAGSSNSMLQAVHCTDYLIGKFIDALSKEPDWKNTVVVIMSDHLMMRNDAQSLYPKDYHRQPALLVLNAGNGVRPARMYHMDIAPTLLDLMGVRTNATFIAGDDHGPGDAGGSELVDGAVTDAVLRKALWSRVSEFRLCKKGTLVGWTSDGEFEVGGRELGMSYLGEAQVGVRDDQALDFFIDDANAKLVIADAGNQPELLAASSNASVLTIARLPGAASGKNLFSVDWIGRHGAYAHIADIPRLAGLTIGSRHCSDVIARVDRAPRGAKLDVSRDFSTTTAPWPELPSRSGVKFTQPGAAAYEAGLGWLPPANFGSWTIGAVSTFGFSLPSMLCRPTTTLRMWVDPYLPPSRPKLDVEVLINGKPATTWHFAAPPASGGGDGGASDRHDVLEAQVPVDAGAACEARVDLRFARPDASPPPYPKAEDPRPLQLRVLRMRAVSPES